MCGRLMLGTGMVVLREDLGRDYMTGLSGVADKLDLRPRKLQFYQRSATMLGETWRRGERGVGLMRVSVILRRPFIGMEVAEVRDSLVEMMWRHVSCNVYNHRL